MSFCTHCGNRIEETAKFCGKCGAPIERQQEAKPASNDSSVKNAPANLKAGPALQANGKSKKWKVGGIAAIALLMIGYFIMAPKQLSVQEYEELAINLLVADEMAMQEFGETVDYSGIYFGLSPDWSAEYRQFVEPAEQLERDFVQLRKELEKVKPPRQFEFEHETMLRAFAAHETMAASLGAYMETGREEHMESFEEYESRAEDYIEESIFASEQYEDRVYEAYQSSMMD